MTVLPPVALGGLAIRAWENCQTWRFAHGVDILVRTNILIQLRRQDAGLREAQRTLV
jgi:hypothetical protein